MANQVYANNMEVSCKQAAGKSICAFPDVCFTPPQTPATPPGVPIPYPNTGMASDCTSGSSTVKISGQEVMLKNKSYFKKSTGDEAGCAPKKGVVTSKNMGKVYFTAWSMDVKVEGENVVRNLDVTTHNHGSVPGNSPTWPYLDEAAFAVDSDHPCAKTAKTVQQKCGKHLQKTKSGAVKRSPSIKAMCADGGCRDAMKCVLTPKSPSNCCPDESGKSPTPHHIVPASQFHEMGKKSSPLHVDADGEDKYDYNKAPCICVDGESHSVGTHGKIHSTTNRKTRETMGVAPNTQIPGDKRWSLGQAEKVGAEAVQEETGCDAACTEAQLRSGHQEMELSASSSVRPTTAGGEDASHGATGLD
jgi:hypothetical protein